MRVVPTWTKEELGGEAKYSDAPKISNCLYYGQLGLSTELEKTMREETAYLEKVLDTLQLADFKRAEMKLAAERLTGSLEQYINGIVDRDIPIEMNYLIWATIAVRKKYKVLGGDGVDTKKVLTEAILN